MKRILFILTTILSTVILLLFTTAADARKIETPTVSTSFTQSAKISDITLDASSTIITLDVSPTLSKSDKWVSISSNTYISYINPGTGASETKTITAVTNASGTALVFGHHYYSLPNNAFVLKFPALPDGVERINLIENGEWEWYGIDIAPEEKEEEVTSGIFSSADFDDDETEDYAAMDTVAVDDMDGDEDDYEGRLINSLDEVTPEVTSVAGIDFGISKSEFKTKLHERFGYDHDEVDEGNIYHICDVRIGQVDYSFANFYFVNGKLDAASLEKYYPVSKFQEAKNQRDNVANLYRYKYPNISSQIDKDGRKYYLGGKPDNPLFPLYPIKISVEKSKGRDGVTRYYLMVVYFGYKMGGVVVDDI